MHTWDVIDMYSQYHPRWFESPDRYVPTDDYLAVYREFIPDSWSLQRSGIWFYAEPPEPAVQNLPDQGWKLHVSVSTKDSVEVLRGALPILEDELVPFKFLVDPWITASVNGKLWPRGSSGKFMAIYPLSLAQFHRLGSRLSARLGPLCGPYILSDRRWPESRCVYYRYGAFQRRSVLRVDGMHNLVIQNPQGALLPDRRNPYWSPPNWVTDPFDSEASRSKTSQDVAQSRALCDGRFSILSALHFTNRGGVYSARDNETGRRVVLKEARPRIEIGSKRIDAIDALEKEYRLLECLAETGYFVQPVAFFSDWEHAFLAEEYVEGETLGRFTIRRNPLYWNNVSRATVGSYLQTMRDLWLQIARAIDAAHTRNVVLGDLSFTNIFVTGDSQIKIIDLETAAQEHVDPAVGLYTPGVASPEAMKVGISDRSNDYYALGALLFGSLMLANSAIGFHPPLLRRFVKHLKADLALPRDLIYLMNDLFEQPARNAARPELVISRIENLPIEPVTSPNEPRLEVPAESRRSPEQRTELREKIVGTVEGVTRYLLSTADPSRTDRLVPADITVFETNPLSVAYGAAGVLYTLNRICGEVPRELTEWMMSHIISNDKYPPGLYLGQAGIAWVLAELNHMDIAVHIMRQARTHELLFSSANVLHGASGYGLACLNLWSASAGHEFLDEAVRVGDWLIQSCASEKRGVCWPDSDGTVRVGYALGASGIALFLLYLHLATGDPKYIKYGRQALDFELAQGGWVSGRFAGFPAQVGEASEAPPVFSPYWFVGTAGVGTALIRYLTINHDDELERWRVQLQPDVSRKYVVFPQLFNGLAGIGNFQLDLWQYTNDERHLAEAWQAAEGVLLFAIERGEGITFPGEQAMRESGDLATGGAGAALFFDRLLKAEEGDGTSFNFNFVLDKLLPSPVNSPLKEAAD